MKQAVTSQPVFFSFARMINSVFLLIGQVSRVMEIAADIRSSETYLTDFSGGDLFSVVVHYENFHI